MAQTIFLWNDSLQRLSGAEVELPNNAFPEKIDAGGDIYHPLSFLPRFYIHPATETSLVNAVFHIFFKSKNISLPEPHASGPGQDFWNVNKWSNIYGVQSRRLLNNLDLYASLDDFLVGEWPNIFISLKEDQVGFFENYSPRKFLHARMIRDLRALPALPKRVIEIGSGMGVNVCALKKEFPEIAFCGVEPSKEGVEVSRAVAKKFGLEVEFIKAGLDDGMPTIPDKSFDLAFTHGLFIVMTTPLQEAMRHIHRIAQKWLFLYEPFSDLLPPTARGWASAFYLKNFCFYQLGVLNRLLADEEKFGFYRVRETVRLRHAQNPLEETSFAKVELL